jgi:hypothetical protein
LKTDYGAFVDIELVDGIVGAVGVSVVSPLLQPANTKLPANASKTTNNNLIFIVKRTFAQSGRKCNLFI